MKSCLVFIWSMILFSGAMSQANSIKGRVLNGETGAVIANASVFITNSSRGTVSNSNGEFELENVPVGTYDLVVSCISYETQVYTYKASQLPLRIQIQMKQKAEELQAVVVEPYEKDGWDKWGKFFLDNFIGLSNNAKDCEIKNTNVLHFRNSKKRNTLEVVATEPLIIENKALGYRIKYQLENFTYNFNENSLIYLGFTLFSNLNNRAPKKWQLQNRSKVYSGSIAHFMSSLFHNQLAADGFEVKRLYKWPNLEKQRIKQLYRAHRGDAWVSKDSSNYYSSILRKPDMFEKYGPSLLTADSLVTIIDSSSRQLFFNDFLYITYKKEKEDPSYLQYTHENRAVFYQRSVVFLVNANPLTIDEKGNYFMPQDFMSYGYWSWSEKIACMLPVDYK